MAELKLDILAFAAHPDDGELGCSGTLAKHAAMGKKVGIVDLTQGELGTRGSAELRLKEAAASAKVLGLHARENLGLPDGFLRNIHEQQIPIIRAIRKYRPDVVLANALDDRHPDHCNGSRLVREAAFLSGLVKIETESDGVSQTPWRPKDLYYYIQDRLMMPDFVIDITPFWDLKMQSIKAFGSQFFDPSSKEPATYISSQNFIEFIDARAREMGHLISTKYGEGFMSDTPIKVDYL